MHVTLQSTPKQKTDIGYIFNSFDQKSYVFDTGQILKGLLFLLPQKPELKTADRNNSQDSSIDIDHEEIRSLGTELATANPAQAKRVDDIAKEEKTLTVLNSVVNFARKIGSKALNAGGFIPSTSTKIIGIKYLWSANPNLDLDSKDL